MAAVTPIFIGFLHDLTQRWTLALQLMIALTVVQVVMGYQTGRARTIADPGGAQRH
jgi:cyanate permease